MVRNPPRLVSEACEYRKGYRWCQFSSENIISPIKTVATELDAVYALRVADVLQLPTLGGKLEAFLVAYGNCFKMLDHPLCNFFHRKYANANHSYQNISRRARLRVTGSNTFKIIRR